MLRQIFHQLTTAVLGLACPLWRVIFVATYVPHGSICTPDACTQALSRTTLAVVRVSHIDS